MANFSLITRKLVKDYKFTLISISGLTFGLSTFLIILAVLFSEQSYDSYHEKKDQIYRVGTVDITDGNVMDLAITSHELAPLLQAEFPEVTSYTRFLRLGEVEVITSPDLSGEKFKEEKIYRSDDNVFQNFTFEFLAGHAETSLVQREQIVLTRSLAEKYFGNINEAVGKSLQVEQDGLTSHIVTGVIEDLPVASHLRFDALISGIPDRGFTNDNGTINTSRLFAIDYLYTYIVVPQQFNPVAFKSNWDLFVSKYYQEESERLGSSMTHNLTLLEDVHYYANQDFDLPAGDVNFLRLLFGLGILILVITSINYINLTTARAGKSFKEISLRKVFGASKSKLVLHVLTENIWHVFLAYVVSLIAVRVTFGTGFFEWLAFKIDGTPIFGLSFNLVAFLSVMVVGVLSGLYPAFFVVRNANLAEKSIVKHGKFNLRSFLVAVQVAFSFGITVLTLHFSNQINFILDSDLGYDYENTVVLSSNNRFNHKASVLQHIPNRLSDIEVAAITNFIPGTDLNQDSYRKRSGTADEPWMSISHVRATPNYFDALKLRLKQTSQDRLPVSGATKNVVLNEAAVSFLKLENPLQESLEQLDGSLVRIVGVVENFNFKSLHYHVEPLVISIEDGANLNHLVIRSHTSPNRSVSSNLRQEWESVFNDKPFNLFHYSSIVAEQYANDEGKRNMFVSFSIVGIVISLIGFIGLAAYSTNKMTKQIMVRKVLGASYVDRLTVLLKGKIAMVMISSIVAVPAVYFTFYNWIDNYHYQVGFSSAIVVATLSAFVAIVVVIGVLISQKVMNSNPAELLKHE